MCMHVHCTAAVAASWGRHLRWQHADITKRFCLFAQVGLGKETKATVTLGFTKSNELFVGRLASAARPRPGRASSDISCGASLGGRGRPLGCVVARFQSIAQAL